MVLTPVNCSTTREQVAQHSKLVLQENKLFTTINQYYKRTSCSLL